jgi:hypothetical protein
MILLQHVLVVMFGMSNDYSPYNKMQLDKVYEAPDAEHLLDLLLGTLTKFTGLSPQELCDKVWSLLGAYLKLYILRILL